MDLDPIFSQQFNIPPPQQGGGMFAGGGKFNIGQAIIGALNGYLASRGNPAGVANMQMMQQAMLMKQRQAQQEAQYQRHRGDQLADSVALHKSTHDYDVANPSPGQPSEFETALTDSGIHPGTPEWAAAMKQRKDNMLDPVVMTPQGPMLRSQLIQGGQPAAPGVTFTPINGGPSPGGSGGFPY